MKIPNDFAVFILSHGRPDHVVTYHSLEKHGYTGQVFIVIDNEDKTAARYYENFGKKVIMFDKAAIAETFDEADNFGDRRAVIYARNACFNIARQLGLTYFMELDDDYKYFAYKIDENFHPYQNHVKNLDFVLMAMLEYYKSIQAKSLAMAQGGDYMGGIMNDIDVTLHRRRKAMNTFICSVDRPFQFVGRINEDVNTYTWYQSLGNLFLTWPFVMVEQYDTQQNKGGMSDLYLNSGTYVKSFYPVLFSPASVRITMMPGAVHKRLHHQITWSNTVPYIIPESYRKPDRLVNQDTTR